MNVLAVMRRELPRWTARGRMVLENVADLTLDLGHQTQVAYRANRLRFVAAGVSMMLVVVGVVLLMTNGTKHRVPNAPQDVAIAPPAVVSASTAPPPAQRSVPVVAGPPVATNAFMHISIPAIGVAAADVIKLGINADRSIQVPPLDNVAKAGWYKYSPLPGDVGPSIVLGHINSARQGAGVFSRLDSVHAGDLITVVRSDHKTAVFRADQVAEYPKNNFPTQQIYGNTDGAKIRLISCGGKFNSSTGSYLDNIVVYGSLVSLRRT